ncbi:hypothetical protein [Massilia scottii]|uniref:hypothetical protein n=1 Tax=Massilia scottii TaxID=3057166 RepID=UPI00279643B7|nr:hypothetical protein [Massilia sp. CCM 9029]MDQ1833869.1 hypothetical protein [Massilia sp. CCM 9029]
MKNNLEEKNAASGERPGMAVSMTAAVLRRSLAWATLVLSCAAHAGTPPLSPLAGTATPEGPLSPLARSVRSPVGVKRNTLPADQLAT